MIESDEDPTITYELQFQENCDSFPLLNREQDAVEDAYKKGNFYQALMAFFQVIKPHQDQVTSEDPDEYYALKAYLEVDLPLMHGNLDSYLEAMEELGLWAWWDCSLVRIESGNENLILNFRGSYDPDKNYLYDKFDFRLDFQDVLNEHAIYFKELSDAQIESVKASFNQPNCWGVNMEE